MKPGDENGEKKPVFSWVYEKWNKIVTSDKYPSIQGRLADLHKGIMKEEKIRKSKIETAR